MGKFLESQITSTAKHLFVKKAGKSGHNLKKPIVKRDESGKSCVSAKANAKRKINESSEHDQPSKKSKTDNASDQPQEGEYDELEGDFQEEKILHERPSVMFKQLADSDVYVLSEDADIDLFCSDEYSARYDQYTQFNFMFKIFDEIALEGLDGITLEALWKRLKHCLKYPTVLDNFKKIIWNIICCDERIKFYRLPQPRGELIISDVGVMTEEGIFQEVLIPNLYQLGPVPKDCKELGSCAAYTTREDVTAKVRKITYWDAFYTFGNSLVMVADQELRSYALINDTTDPSKEFSSNEYNVLEKIGRSRDIGEINNSVSAVLNLDPKTTHYYKKCLLASNLVISQNIIIRSLADYSKTGRLLQLRRFYNQRKAKTHLVAEYLINTLKIQPNYRMDRALLINRFKMSKKHTKYLLHSNFAKYVTCKTVPYRTMYPDAKKSEYLLKKNTEKQVAVMELTDPYVNISYDQEGKIDSSDEEDENEENTTAVGTRSMNVDLTRDVYLAVLNKGSEGLSVNETFAQFNCGYYTARAILRKLANANAIHTKKIDTGKTKTTAFIATCYLKNNNQTPSQVDPSETKTSNSILEKLKTKQQAAIESGKNYQIYTQSDFFKDQESFYESNSFLPVIYSISNIKCTYLAESFKILNEKHQKFDTKPVFNETIRSLDYKLGFLNYTTQDVIDIDKIWGTLNQNNVNLKLTTKINIKNIYENKRQIDVLTMLFLLRAFFEDIVIISSEVLNTLDASYVKEAAKVDTSSAKSLPIVQEQRPLTKAERKADQLNYMGHNPITIFAEERQAVQIEMLGSTPSTKEKIRDIHNYRPSWANTERALDRAKKVIEIVNEEKVIEEFHKLTKNISNSESKEGYDKKIDRKSLMRLIKHLVEDGLCKVMSLNIKKGDLIKTKKFICAPEETHLHPLIQSQIDQLMYRYFMSKPVSKTENHMNVTTAESSKTESTNPHTEIEGVKVKKSPFVATDVLKSISQYKALKIEMKEADKKLPKFDVYFSRKYYGFQQKFVRLSILHEILFYLIYELPKDATTLSKDEVRELFKEYQIYLCEEDIESMPPIYCKEISWKMFMPPLPAHVGWPEGWALVCDIILRIPISLILKIFNCTVASRELAEVVNHPIRRFFLLSFNSDHVKSLIMAKRRYVLEIYQQICFLAYCGLVQFGPVKLCQRDQVFIYLNRKASLLNTITSAPGYHKVEDKEYPRISFTLNSIADVQHYWFTMYDISQQTKLNSANAVKGRTITICSPSYKADLQKTLEAKTADEVLVCDTGEIPGDHRGAAGLDSALWAHKNINWIMCRNNMPKHLPPSLLKDKLEVQTEPVNYSNLQQTDKFPKKIFLPKKSVLAQPKQKRIVLVQKGRPRKIERHVQVRFVHGYPTKEKRKYYDQIDLMILKKTRPSRTMRAKVKWTPEEDRVLIILKVASILLTSMWGLKQNITYITIRDALHIIIPSSAKTKTSRAVQRRFKIIFKQYKILSKVEMNIPNLMKMEPLVLYLKPLMDKLNNSEAPLKLTQQQLANAFLFLSSYFAKNMKEVESVLHGAIVGRADYLSQENIHFTESNIVPFDDKDSIYEDPQTEENVVVQTLQSALISALSSKATQNETYWSFQVFSTYRKFKNTDLKAALNFLYSRRFISRRRFKNKSQMQFVMSNYYVYNQNTTYSFKLAEDVYKNFDKVSNGELISIKDFNELHMPERLVLSEILTFGWSQLDLKFNLPDYMIILDPAVDDHSEIITELARRYHLKLKNEQELRAIKASIDLTSDEVLEIKTELQDFDIIDVTEDIEEPTNDLKFKSGNTVNMTDLRNWIEGCIKVDRSRSPSPERLINREPAENEETMEEICQYGDKSSPEDDPSKGILSIEEIQEEMLKDPSSTNKKRAVPYVLDLLDLLSENFEEIDTDMDNLKKHFVPRFPVLEEYGVEHLDEFKNHHLVQFLNDELQKEQIWNKIQSSHRVGFPTPLDQLHDIVIQNGGSPQEISLLDDIVTLVAANEVGVSGTEINERFAHQVENLSLHFLLSLLTSHNVLIQTGVCSVIFVHHIFKKPWILNVSVISEEDREFIENTKVKDREERSVMMEKNLEFRPTIDMKVFPWVNLNGEVNTILLKIWLTNILSHCIEHPKLWMRSLCEKYFMLKPVDVYFLLEMLQDLGCLRISRYKDFTSDLFSPWQINEECAATFLDDFDKIFIEPSIISFTALGSFFYKI